MLRNFYKVLVVLAMPVLSCPAFAQSYAACPGVILSEIDSWLVYTSDPCILVLSNGDYLASHAQFGTLSGSDTSGRTKIFRSSDKGVTWTKVNGGNDITGILRGSLFEHGGAVYMLGSNHDEAGSTAVMLKSVNNGNSWSKVSFSPMGGFATPDNVVPFNGRYWLTSSRSSVSAPVSGSDLFSASAWTVTGGFPTPQSSWLPGTGFNVDDNFIGEGQTAVSGTGVFSLAKVRMLPYFTVSSVNPVTGTVHFDPDRDFVPMPGGEKKFGVRYDAVSGKYFMLANPILAAHLGSGIAVDLVRNTAAVYSSKDLRNWRVEKIFLYSPNVSYEGFQYFNFDFDGDDIVVASRTAFDVGNGKPPRGHDTNLLTFHRIPDFRNLTRDHVLKLESGVAKRHEKTQHRDAPLGNFALGTSFAGAALTGLNGFAQSDGDVYLRETGGRILKFDLAGNFLEVVGSSPEPFQTTEMALPQPPARHTTWAAVGNGTWDEPRNWHDLNRPGTGEDTAVFGSSVTAANATITIPSITRRWDFNTAGNFENWTVGAGGENMQVSGGVLQGNLSANGTGVTLNRANLNFPGNEVRQVRVRLKIDSPDSIQVRFYWGTITNNSFAFERRVDLNYTGKGQFQELVFEPTGHAQWDGNTITRIRVDPLSSATYQGVAFEVDYVSVPADSDGRSLAGLSFLGPANYTLGGAGALRLSPATGDGLVGIRTGNHTVAVPIEIDANTQLEAATGTSLTFSGVIGGADSAALVKSGQGTVTLSADNTFEGTVEARQGSLVLNRAGGTLGDASTLALNGGTVQVNQSDTIGTFRRILAGTITGAGQITSGAYDFAHPSGTATLGQGGVGTEVTWSGPLIKSGASTLVIADSPSYSGGTEIRGGTLQVGTGSITGLIPGNVVNDGELHFNRSDSFTFSGAISGNGSLRKSGAGTLILTGTNSHTGGTTIEGGTLQAGNGTEGWLAGPVVNNGALVFGRSDSFAFAGEVSGCGGVTKANTAGTLTLSGNSTFAGPVAVLFGSLSVASLNSVAGGTTSSNLGAPSTTGNGTISLGTGVRLASLVYTGKGETTDRTIRLVGVNDTGNTLTQSGSGLLKFTSDLAFNSNSQSYILRLNGSTAGTGEFAGAITNGTGGLKSIRKEGTGVWTLSGNLSYAGNTTVSAGRLIVKNHGLADTASVSIASGAVIQLDHGSIDAIGELWIDGVQQWRGVWGAPGSSARFQSASLAGTGLLEVTSGPGVPFAGWAMASGLTGEPGRENGVGDDPEADGLPNGIEWVLDGDPLASDNPSVAPHFDEYDAANFVFTFQRTDESESATTVIVEYSTTLATSGWTQVLIGATSSSSPGGVEVTVTEHSGAPDTISVILPKSLAPTGRLFTRLKVVVSSSP